jgi:deoxyribodipyrimidine photo-lyase
LGSFAENRIYDYAEARNWLDLAGTSQLSPYLHFGMVSARQTAVTALRALKCAQTAEAKKGAATWLNELIWREFYISILYHFPQVLQRSFRQQYDAIQWCEDEALFERWQNGRTGFPVIDAAMQQLLKTGWMHNRARMIVASFLVKDLLINWQWGERHFMQHLVDGDLASNNGGWQWTAGVGTDAAPYFRIFNPVLQSKKFDHAGQYIRRWLPQLTNVPDKYIHEPAIMPLALQKEIGCIIGQQYPAPVVDHKQARQRTLEAYGEAKQ